MNMTLLCVLIMLIITLSFLMFKIIKCKNRKYIVLFSVIFLYFVYSFFTTVGSVRLAIALMGHPISAYTTSFKYSNREDSKNQYLLPKKIIPISGGAMEYMECKTYGIIKFSSHYGGG